MTPALFAVAFFVAAAAPGASTYRRYIDFWTRVLSRRRPKHRAGM